MASRAFTSNLSAANGRCDCPHPVLDGGCVRRDVPAGQVPHLNGGEGEGIHGLKPMPLNFPREVLLVEIERYCSFRDCAARNQIGLTKAEAIEYRGFDCRKCQRWNDDTIGIDAVPDSWADAIPLNDSETAN